MCVPEEWGTPHATGSPRSTAASHTYAISHGAMAVAYGIWVGEAV